MAELIYLCLEQFYACIEPKETYAIRTENVELIITAEFIIISAFVLF